MPGAATPERLTWQSNAVVFIEKGACGAPFLGASNLMGSPESILLITTITTAIVTIVNAIAAGWGREHVKERLEDIHHLANDNLAKQTKALEIANEKIVNLERMLATLVAAQKQ